MNSRRRGLRPLASAFESLRDELAPATLLAQIQRVWPETVGSAIAAEATPTAERGGVLTISCAAAVWAQELDLMAPTIVERLNRNLGERRVDRLRCIAV
jgi:predicted nucleic acid-binding Zn ribbon protein